MASGCWKTGVYRVPASSQPGWWALQPAICQFPPPGTLHPGSVSFPKPLREALYPACSLPQSPLKGSEGLGSS